MSQAKITYRHNTEPRRGLATAGIFMIKAIMAIPHLIIINGLSTLAFGSAYVGYWVVAFTGKLPNTFQDFGTWYLRWQIRTFGWYFGNEDAYPPFEMDASYSVDLEVPHNDAPRTGWAVAGIFMLKYFAAIPHLIVLAILAFVVMVITWFGFIVAAVTGRLPIGIQEFAAGALQWEARVLAWVFGLTDRYPPFSLQAAPAA